MMTKPGRRGADCSRVPVLVVYDGVDEGIVDGGGLCYDGGNSLGVRRQDISMSESDSNEEVRIFSSR